MSSCIYANQVWLEVGEMENMLVMVFAPVKTMDRTSQRYRDKHVLLKGLLQGLLSAPMSTRGYTAEGEMQPLQQSSAQQMKQIEV